MKMNKRYVFIAAVVALILVAAWIGHGYVGHVDTVSPAPIVTLAISGSYPYYLNSTIRIVATVTNFTGSLVNATGSRVLFYNSTSNLQATFTNATYVSLGVYYVYYTLPLSGKAGQWYVDWTAYVNGYPGRAKLQFNVYS